MHMLQCFLTFGWPLIANGVSKMLCLTALVFIMKYVFVTLHTLTTPTLALITLEFATCNGVVN